MKIILDPDVSKVAEFMMRNVKARDLRRVARALAQMADLVWQPELLDLSARLRPFTLSLSDEPRPSESPQQPTSTLHG